MSSFQLFGDLPQIKVQDSMPTEADNFSVYSLDIDSSRTDSTQDTFGRLSSTPNPAALDRAADMQIRLSEMEKSVAGHSQIYSPNVPGPSYSYYPALDPLTLPSREEFQAYTGHGVRYMSPSGSWGGDRSGTEIDSAPSEGSRSPRSNWNYGGPYQPPEHIPNPNPFSPGYQTHQPAMETAGGSFPTVDQRSSCDGMVTPQELHPYPDPEAEVTPNGFRSLERDNPIYTNQAEEDLGVVLDVDMNHDAGDDDDCPSPRKKTKRGNSSYPGLDGSTAQRPAHRNKRTPSTPNRTPRPGTQHSAPRRGRPSTTERNNPKPKPGNQGATRLFICSLSHYGCTSTFRSKNEWKRHIMSQHLKLGFFRCDIGFCNAANEKKRAWNASRNNHIAAQSCPHDFNRKDLFTQHQRRMHKPQSLIENPSERLNKAFEASLEPVRQRCWVENRRPPPESLCGFCGRHFAGPKSWEERMEHVGKHFEQGDRDEQEDEALREWALGEGLIQPSAGGGWVLTGRD